MRTTIKLFALLVTSSVLFSCQSDEVNPAATQHGYENVAPAEGRVPDSRTGAGSVSQLENAI
ncbi:MAG TPA: hypothetical protein VGN64_03565 [Dyadobacter sp.]|jgi:hypothetical protein|nr:hypothetical protein [Dyadobacter sp.]